MIKEARSQPFLQKIYNAAANAMSGLMDTRNMYIALYNAVDKSIEFPLWYQEGRLIPDREKTSGHQAGPRHFGGRLLGSCMAGDDVEQDALFAGLQEELRRIGAKRWEETTVTTLEKGLRWLVATRDQEGKEKTYTVIKQDGRLNIYERFGLTDWVILHKESLLIQANFNEEVKQRGIAVFDIGTRCWLGAPMLLHDEVVGVIGLQNFEHERIFDANQRDLLMTIASQTAVAIENVQTMERLKTAAAKMAAHEERERMLQELVQERQRRLSVFQQISNRLAEVVNDPDSVLKLVVESANEVTQSYLSSVYLYDENTSSFTRGVRLLRGRDPEDVPDDDLPDTDGDVARVADSQKEIYERKARLTTFTERYHIKSFAALPLKTASEQGFYRTVGVLLVNYRQQHDFHDDEKEILHHLANQAAIAIAYTEARASAAANEQLAALGSATATLQHRLGNTISITLPAVLRLRYRIGNDPVIEEILDTIERNTQFANEVIQRMQTPLRPEPFVRTSINSLLSTAILQCVDAKGRFPRARLSSSLLNQQGHQSAEQAELPKIHIEANLSADLPETYASIGRLQEVFRVLVENAIKAIYPNSGEVRVESKLRSGGRRPVIEVTVTDNGKGIEEKVRKRLFRQPVPRKEFGEGAGLGLWLSRIVVLSHQGSIDLQSTELGQGSTFFVRLPVLSRAPVTVQLDGENV